MNRLTRSLTAGAALAAMLAGGLLPQAANAAMRHHGRGHMKKAKVVLIPAHPRPGYMGYAGYTGGPAGTTPPMLVDLGGGTALSSGGILTGGLLGTGAAGPGLLGGGGLLGTGILPASGLLAGVPVVGGFGL